MVLVQGYRGDGRGGTAARLAWQRKRRAMQIRESMEEIDINIRCDDRRAVAVG